MSAGITYLCSFSTARIVNAQRRIAPRAAAAISPAESPTMKRGSVKDNNATHIARM